MRDALGRPQRVVLLGGTSEIGLAVLAHLDLGPDAEVVLAGRDDARLAAAGEQLPCHVATVRFDALDLPSHAGVVDAIFDAGDVDVLVAATGVLVPQERLDTDPMEAARLVDTNVTAHVTTLLAAAARMRVQGHGTLVVLSSVAAVRARRSNYVYGASKAALDAFGQGLSDALHGSGVGVLVVRPGFVVGRMTQGMAPAPLSSTADAVGVAVADALAKGRVGTLWVPAPLAVLALALRLVPRPLWRRIER